MPEHEDDLPRHRLLSITEGQKGRRAEEQKGRRAEGQKVPSLDIQYEKALAAAGPGPEIRARFFTKTALKEWQSRYPVDKGPTGLCFPYANLALKRFGDDAVVVHAKILSPAHGKRRIHHAWIEHEGRVYDYQNAEMLNTSIPIGYFYEVTRPTSVKRYAPHEALIMSCRTQKHGPWP